MITLGSRSKSPSDRRTSCYNGPLMVDSPLSETFFEGIWR